jgi:hypothetical protein
VHRQVASRRERRQGTLHPPLLATLYHGLLSRPSTLGPSRLRPRHAFAIYEPAPVAQVAGAASVGAGARRGSCHTCRRWCDASAMMAVFPPPPPPSIVQLAALGAAKGGKGTGGMPGGRGAFTCEPLLSHAAAALTRAGVPPAGIDAMAAATK